MRVARFEQKPRFPVSNQLAVTANIGRHEHLSHRHRLERLQRRHELGEPHAQPRIHEHVDTLVVALNFVERNTPREGDLAIETRCRRPLPEPFILGSATNEKHTKPGTFGKERRERGQ